MSDLINNLNPEQKEVVVHESGPLLIVAGAGTGKTTVITQRISYLINKIGCRPDEILALTFTDKSAGEMEERVDRLLPYGYVDLWISTFHSFAERILKQHGLEIGLPNDFKLLSSTGQWLLVRQNLDKFKLDYYRPLGNPTKFIHALLRHFSRAKDECITTKDYLDYTENLKLNSDSAEFVKTVVDDQTISQLSTAELKEVIAQEIQKQAEVANAYHTYQQLLLDNDALDFGDLINYCLKLFQERKNILAQYRQQFKYVLVDEFQDTNYAQYELVKLLSKPKNNITVVGDDDQAIYKFRGASISNILQFKDDFPQTKEIFLINNYRSSQNILDLSYDFICQNNPYRLEVKLQGEKKLSKKLISNVKSNAMIEHLHSATLVSEVRLAIDKIIELYNQSQDTNWSDFAILIRANASADDFAYGLDQAKIPYNFVASKGLYNKNIVLDILAYLKLLDSYHESSAMYRILVMPLWQIGQSDIINLNYWAGRKGWSIYETLHQSQTIKNISAEAKSRINKILTMIDGHSQLVRDKKNVTEVVQAFLTDSGYLKFLSQKDSSSNREELNYLNQFYKKIQEFERSSSDKTTKNYLELINLELEAGDAGSLSQNLEEESPDTIKIMTVHSAKGLEFKYVFIVNLVDKRFPAIGRSEPIEIPAKLIKEVVPEGDVHLQEERRLFYVAMTRAKAGLYFTSADDYGGGCKKKISRFLIELNKQGLELSSSKQEHKKIDIFDQPKKAPLAVKESDLILPNKFSFTQLKAFKSCPYQYRFAHILRIPIKGKAQTSFGQSMHLALQKFFLLVNLKNRKIQPDLFDPDKKSEVANITWDELFYIYRESFIDNWYSDKKIKNDYFKKGEKSLKNFFEYYNQNKPVAKYLEYSFNLRLGDNGGDCLIKGKIDRVDAVDGSIKIVDYKTGSPKSKLALEDKEQLLIYQIAAQEVMKEDVKALSFYYLDNNQEISFLGSQQELDKIRAKIIKTIGEIRQGEFPPKPGQICAWCDFNSICEYRA